MTYNKDTIKSAHFALAALLFLILATIIDEIIVIALLFSIIEENYSPLAVAWLFFCQMVPAILIAPFSGPLIDYYGSRQIIKIVGTSQIITLFFLSTADSLTEIYVISAFLSCHVAFTGPAIFALIVPVGKIARISVNKTNILLEITRSVGTIAGPAIGGLSIGLLSIQHTILFASLSFGLFIAFILYCQIDTVKSGAKQVRFDIRDFKLNYRPVLRHKSLCLIFGIFGCIVFSTSFSDVLFPFFTLGPLEGTAMAVGLLIAIWSMGLFAGASMLAYANRSKRNLGDFELSSIGAIIMGVSLLLCGVCALLLQPLVALRAVAALFFFGGMGNGIHNVSVRNAIILSLPEGQHGRAFSLYTAIVRIGALLGFFIGGLVSSSYVIEGYIISGMLAGSIGAASLLFWQSLQIPYKGDRK